MKNGNNVMYRSGEEHQNVAEMKMNNEKERRKWNKCEICERKWKVIINNNEKENNK